ncbi:hypothetical protein [Pseudomonas sp. CCOS 191]|uniref:hypothetical protein n=1 Tax=Pseudomonas sp. CCOS 191 TaxID=1649877 RepID=UPI000624A9A4|nr:hypothetical protein [Pseudomonas sp. CCOS 191]CRI57749.1 hypothetical protein CCOS191_3213 [Pseudomonas sp. CCOS 191]
MINPQVIAGFIVGLVFSVFGFFALLAFVSDQSSIFVSGAYNIFKDILGPVAAGFGGAIAGAFATYRLQSLVEDNKSKVTDVSNYNRGVEILSAKNRDLWVYKRQVIEKFQKHELRFLKMPDFPEMPINSLMASDYLNELLIRFGMGSEISALMTAERKYVATISNLWQRNRMIAKYRMELDEFFRMRRTRYTPSLGDLVRVHGHTRLLRLYEYTEMAIDDLDRSLAAFYKILISLQRNMAKHIAYQNLNILEVKPWVPEPTTSPHFKSINELSVALDNAMKEKKRRK